MDRLRDFIWPALVRYALDRGDCIVQRALVTHVADGFIFRPGWPLPDQPQQLRFDYNFMSLGARTVHALFRVTSARDLTSIVGAEGGLGMTIGVEDARAIISYLE
jgi:hypothetical protein